MCCDVCRLESDFCPGSLWVADQRFAWFDLTANLTFYGPGPGGKGQVGQLLWLGWWLGWLSCSIAPHEEVCHTCNRLGPMTLCAKQ